jgi:deoxycytidine triphosphate deaminase
MLSDGTIRKLLQGGEIKCFIKGDASESVWLQDWQIQPASIDLRLGDMELERPHNRTAWKLEAGQHCLARTAEYIGICSALSGRVEGKSTWARRGLLVHTAGFIDPGFRGHITLELKNLGHKPITLLPMEPIVQICFGWLDAPALRPYGSPGLRSHYQGQTGITEAHNAW